MTPAVGHRAIAVQISELVPGARCQGCGEKKIYITGTVEARAHGWKFQRDEGKVGLTGRIAMDPAQLVGQCSDCDRTVDIVLL